MQKRGNPLIKFMYELYFINSPAIFFLLMKIFFGDRFE